MKTTISSFIFLFAIYSNAQLEPIEEGIYKWNDFPVKKSELKEGRSILEGSSPHLEYIEMHATTQMPGATPGPAHANKDIEECIIVREGTMKITIEGKSTVLGPEGVVLLMPQQMHQMENIGDTNLTYYVIRYRSKKPMNIERGSKAGGSLMINADSLTYMPSSRGGGVPYFDRETAMCERYEMHVTQLDKLGPSHEPHKHIETEIILMMAGNTEMTIAGKTYQAGPGDFYLAKSGSMHGIKNLGEGSCRYFAFKWN
ncbi:cupin domain-containing protein [Pseudozobellia sp. WGM2]|uniref:cupin domain-containing protein n=1 Tax=Pseudozobellia sp. WGM2 TaxID=2787625 RepID=UPI001AE0D7C3|nr:cupin domain-containing protein [Pseudozobellia sp. WGM2]